MKQVKLETFLYAFFSICIFDRGTWEIRTFLLLLAKGLPAQVLFFLWSTSRISLKHTLRKQSCQYGISKGTALPPVFQHHCKDVAFVLCTHVDLICLQSVFSMSCFFRATEVCICECFYRTQRQVVGNYFHTINFVVMPSLHLFFSC